MSDVRVLVVDDHGVVRSGLRSLLSVEKGLKVVSEAATGREAIAGVKQFMPDVVVMDIRMPDLNGIDATREVMAIQPQCKVIGLSADGDDRMAVEFFRAGGMGFVKKEAAYEELVAAIRAALKDTIYCNSKVISRLVEERAGGEGASAFERLSPREREHLQLIAEGKTTKEIAAALDISIKTAETHRRNLQVKLHVTSVAELTKYAIREGLTTP